MIRVSTRSAALVQRLRTQAARLANAYAASRRQCRAARSMDWHSATSLWPEFTGGSADGK